LLLRFATGLSSISLAHATADLSDTAGLLARCVLSGAAVLIWLGLWTPPAALTVAAIQVIIVTVAPHFNVSLVVFAASGVSLAMLGPGAWSIDARLFGRKRIL
jgi:putative oxidoreductase